MLPFFESYCSENSLLFFPVQDTARVKDVANDSYFSRKAGAFAPAFSKRLTTGGALGEGSQNDTIYSAQRKIY